MKNNNEDLIVLKKSSLKQFIGKAFKLLITGYIFLNEETTTFWRRLFSSHSAMRKLLESKAIILLFNTVLFMVVARIFGGLIGSVLFIIGWLNIAGFLILTMGWVNKLLKKNE